MTRFEPRRVLTRSHVTGPILDAIIGGVWAQYQRASDNIFAIAIPEFTVDNVASPAVAHLLKTKYKLEDCVVVGQVRYDPEDGSPTGWRPMVEEDRLTKFVDQATAGFWQLVDRFGSWPSFREFMLCAIHHDLNNAPPDRQMPLDYVCLVGPLQKGKPVHNYGVYRDAGIFIRPEDGVVPLYTHAFFALAVLEEYSRRYAVQMTPEKVRCPGCFLNMLGERLGSAVIKGAMLNEQWPIEFFTCDESAGATSPRHFFLADGGKERYALAGCREKGTKPTWYAQKWDRGGALFAPACHPSSWVENGCPDGNSATMSPQSLEQLRGDRDAAMEDGGYARALESIAAMVEGFGDSLLADDWFKKGVCHSHLRQNDEAIEAYQQCLRMGPPTFQALANMGLCLLQAGQIEPAFTCLRQANAMNRNIGPLWLQVGLYHLNMGRKDGNEAKAVNALKRALALVPEWGKMPLPLDPMRYIGNVTIGFFVKDRNIWRKMSDEEILTP